MYHSTTAQDVLVNLFNLLKKNQAYSNTTDIALPEVTSFAAYDKTVFTNGTVNYLIANLIPDSLNSCGFNEYFNFANRDFRSFSQDNLDFLIALKADIQTAFNETLNALQKATKAAEKASIQVYVLEHAKEKKSQKIIDAAVEAELFAREIQTEAREEFMLARRAEEYFRVIPLTYERMNVDSALWGIFTTLRTDAYNPYLESRFKNVVRHAQNLAAMDVERYISAG